MSDEGQLGALAGAAAAALVGEMMREGWSAVRDLAARIFRHGGEDVEARQLARLDADQAQADELEEAALQERWSRRLLTFVEDFDEAESDLRALADRARTEPRGAVNQSANHSSGTVIQIGGNNSGALNTERR